MLLTSYSLANNVFRWFCWAFLKSKDVGFWALECSLYNESEQDKELGLYALDMIFSGISTDLIINMILDIIILIICLFLLFCKSLKNK